MTALKRSILLVIPVLLSVGHLTVRALPFVPQENRETDSLRQLISLNTDTDDTNKVNLLLELSEAYYDRNVLDTAQQYAGEAISISREISYYHGIIDALYRHGLILNRYGYYKEGIDTVKKMIALSDSLQRFRDVAKGYWLHSSMQSEMGEYEEAIDNLRSSLKMYKRIDDSLCMLSVYNSLGNSFRKISEFDSASVYYHSAMKYCEALGHETGLASVLNNLGKTMYSLPKPDFEQAKEYLFRSLSINKKHNRLYNIALNYSHIGNLYNLSHNLDSAFFYYRLCGELNQKVGNKHGLANNYNNIGEVYEKQGDYRKAFDNYKMALSYYRDQDMPEGINVSILNIADIYVEEGKYRLAHIYYDSAIDLAHQYNIKHYYSNALQNKSNAYYRAGDFRNAYDYLERSYDFTDSIYNIETKARLDEMKIKYEREKDQAEILRLEKANLLKDLDLKRKTSQRDIYLFTGIGIILVISFLFLYFRQKAAKNRIIAEQRIRQLEEEKKVLAAKALVEGQEEERKRIARELHDGLGVLLSTVKMQFTSIKDKSPENKPMIDKATQLLEQASGDVRKISHNMMPGLLTRFGLFEAVDELFEKVGDTEDIIVEKEIPVEAERLPENKEIMLYRILQEILNNTLKHAGAKKIEIRMEVLPGKLKILYADDGVGFNVEEAENSRSIGLQSIRSRVNFLNGKLNIESRPGKGARYSITIPY